MKHFQELRNLENMLPEHTFHVIIFFWSVWSHIIQTYKLAQSHLLAMWSYYALKDLHGDYTCMMSSHKLKIPSWIINQSCDLNEPIRDWHVGTTWQRLPDVLDAQFMNLGCTLKWIGLVQWIVHHWALFYQKFWQPLFVPGHVLISEKEENIWK